MKNRFRSEPEFFNVYLTLDFISHFFQGVSRLRLEIEENTQNKVKIFLKD